MEHYLTKIFKYQLEQKCFHLKACILGRIRLNLVRSILANRVNAGSLLKIRLTFVMSIRKCIKVMRSPSFQKYSPKSVQIGTSSFKIWKKHLTKMMKVKFLLRFLFKLLNHIKWIYQMKNLIRFCWHFRVKKEVN